MTLQILGGFAFAITISVIMLFLVHMATRLKPSTFVDPMPNKHILRLCNKHLPLRLSRTALISELHCDICWERSLKNIDKR